MELRDYIRPILTGLVGIGIVILVIVFIVKLFSGHGGTPQKQINLNSYAGTNATTTLLVDAPTNIDQDHRQVKIIVSSTDNEIDIIQGYQGTVIDSQTYPSNSSAYGAFLASLQLLNFTKGNTDPAMADYRGYCPSGDRYVFAFDSGDGGNHSFQYWSTSCGQGTYGGNRNNTLALFRAQIPSEDFDHMTSGVTAGF